MVFTLGSFVLVTVAVAFVSWLKTKGTDETSKDGYFLGGRSLSGLVIFGSLMMTNLSAEQLVGRNGQGYAAGMTAMGWETMCPIALTLMALFFIPKYFKLGISTIPEFLESRFDRATRVIVSFIFLVAYIVTMLPLVLYAGSVAMERIFGITALMGGNRFMATTVMCVALGIIGGIYAIFGGLKAVAVSDSLNGIIFIIGAVILIPVLAFIALGDGSIAEGIRIFATSSPEHLNAIQPANAQPPYSPWPMIVLGCGINHISYWCTNQSIMQRVLGAKNLKEAQKGSLLTGLTCVFCPIFLVAPGVIQFIRDGGVLTDFDMAYPSLIKDILPTPVLGFFAAVMFGAILSSFNSVLNSASTIYALDIHRPLFNPTASDARMVKIGQNFGTVVAVVSTIMSPFMLYMGGITSFVNSAFAAFNTPIFVCLLCGFFWKKVPAIAAKIVIPVHVVLYFILQFGLRNVIPALNNIHYLYFTAILFVFDMLLMWVIVKMHPRATDFELKDVGAVDLTPWKNGKIWATVTLLIMVLAYIIFSPLGFGKSEKTTYQNYLKNQTTASVSDSVQ